MYVFPHASYIPVNKKYIMRKALPVAHNSKRFWAIGYTDSLLILEYLPVLTINTIDSLANIRNYRNNSGQSSVITSKSYLPMVWFRFCFTEF